MAAGLVGAATSRRRARARRTTAAIALVLALVAAGCDGGGGSSSSTTASTTPETRAVPTGETEATTTTATTTTAVAEAPCTPADFLPVLQEVLDGQAPKLHIVQADVVRCRNGFGRVYAVPDRTVCKPGGGYCYETEQFFLEWTGERWQVSAAGTGLTCGEGMDPDIVEICRALDYPDLSSPTFQLPSRNIGCLLAEKRLRCDIRSGLAPEPSSACDFDWVGLALGTTGVAAPLCGSDTVYERRAPTLAYGSTWRRSGIECSSSTSGLSCTNREGHGFMLAREGWTAS